MITIVFCGILLVIAIYLIKTEDKSSKKIKDFTKKKK
jgi:hypothetical protein